MSDGTVTVGRIASVNSTVTVNVALPSFPQVIWKQLLEDQIVSTSGNAVQVTVVDPTGNNEPEGEEQVTVGPSGYCTS